ncbi:hypothetical protein [Rhizobium leguminosarum]|uniref:hypothetical protein n=1 Tax=Rhizobium leguminosarum TaxID=384 RepID=UPI0036F43F22
MRDTSYGGGDVLVVAAQDRCVKAVVSQVQQSVGNGWSLPRIDPAGWALKKSLSEVLVGKLDFQHNLGESPYPLRRAA